MVGTKKDAKLSSDIYNNEKIIKDFKDTTKMTPSLFDCRNRMQIQSAFYDILSITATRNYPKLKIVPKDPQMDSRSDRQTDDEIAMAPNQGSKCVLI